MLFGLQIRWPRGRMMKSPRPNFFVIGAAKAGTTSLSALLALHPEATMGRIKEPHFFSIDQNYARGWFSYLSLYRDSAGKRAIGDASTSYSRIRYYPRVIQRISRHVPEAKIIYMVRHPVKRIESAYVEHLATAGAPYFRSVNEAVRKQLMILDSSRYWEVFDAYRTALGEQNVKVIWFEEYTSKTREIFREVCRFLDIEDTLPEMATRSLCINDRRTVLERVFKLRGHVQIDTAWTEDTKQWVLDQIQEDTSRFLTHFGRPANYWS